jgi:hypothetical protein
VVRSSEVNANPRKSLREIGIEIDLVTSLTLRDMFTRTEAGKEVQPFLRGIEVKLVYKPGPGGEISGVELTGSPDALGKFFDKFLRDEEPSAYSLSYSDE